MRIGSQVPRLQQWPARASGSAGVDAVEWAESIGWDDDEGHGFYQLDEWQKWCIRGVLSEDPLARLCASISLILVARQNGKNVILEIVELYGFYVLDLGLILHTAHLQETTADHMDRLWDAIQSDPVLAGCTRRVVANGKERLYRTDRRCSIRFRTRSKKVGRGGSPRMVVFDEALYLQDRQVQALLPSLSAQSMRGDAPILIYTSSAPVEESEVLRRVRTAILDGRMPDAFFAEWSVELVQESGESVEQALLRLCEDRSRWGEANPGLGVRISEEWIATNELPTMSPEAFAIDRLGVVLEHGVLTAVPNWSQLVDPDSIIVSNLSWAVAVSPLELGPQWASIGKAGRTADGRLHVEWVEHRAGTAWIVGACKQIYDEIRVPVRVHKSGPEGALIDPLRESGVEVIEMSTADVAAATGQLIGAALSDPPGFAHLGQASLTKAVGGAVLRSGSDGAAIWSQRTSQTEISPLMAVTVAAGGVSAEFVVPAVDQIF